MIILLNKPFNTLCQFRAVAGEETLASYVKIKGVYPAGRLDKDSEGLVLLSDDGNLIHRISDPRHKLPKVYWVQVEGIPSAEALEQLRRGVMLRDGLTLPANVRPIAEPAVWARDPPIRFRRHIPTSWLELTIREGRNRQVRRMTAAVGYPTLRLIRVAIGPYMIGDLQPGKWLEAMPAQAR